MHHLTRRHVITTLTGTAVTLCPALLNAQTLDLDWADIPTSEPIGQSQTMTVAAGAAEVDITTLQPGDVAVIARPTDDENYAATGMTQYIAVMRRTEAQVAAANDREGTVQDPNYFVADLLCPHRGKAIGMTGDPDLPFACTDRGNRHSSVFDGSGAGVSGASDDEFMSIPDYTLTTGDTAVLQLT